MILLASDQPSIYPFGLRIDEPVTTATDLLVALIAFYAAYKVHRAPAKSKVQWNLKYYFLTMGVALTFGGLIGHGFLYLFSFHWKLPGWLTSMIAITFIERASIEYVRPIIRPLTGKVFSWLNIIELIIFVVITFYTLDFFYVQVHSAYGLLVTVFSFHAYMYVRRKPVGSKIFLLAVAVSALSALVFMNEWGLSKWLNHYDISHLLLALAAWIFYKGGKAIIQEQAQVAI